MSRCRLVALVLLVFCAAGPRADAGADGAGADPASRGWLDQKPKLTETSALRAAVLTSVIRPNEVLLIS